MIHSIKHIINCFPHVPNPKSHHPIPGFGTAQAKGLKTLVYIKEVKCTFKVSHKQFIRKNGNQFALRLLLITIDYYRSTKLLSLSLSVYLTIPLSNEVFSVGFQFRFQETRCKGRHEIWIFRNFRKVCDSANTKSINSPNWKNLHLLCIQIIISLYT